MSPYNICLFITKDGGENFGIAAFQTEDTLNIETEAFMKKEKTEIMEAKFKANPKQFWRLAHQEILTAAV